MHIYISIMFLLTGLVLASFINAFLYRIDKEYKYPDIFIKGSHCEKCNKSLKWYELIPILSYIIFKGKCKDCGYKVPVYYPLSELLLGLGFFSLYYNGYPFYYYITLLFLFLLSYYDYSYKGIPKSLTHIFIIYGFLLITLYSIIEGGIIPNSLLISIALSSVLYLMGKVLKKPFGIGDILVLLGLGFVLTFLQFFIFTYLLFISSALFSVIMLLFRKMNLKTAIPLLPFMLIAYVITVLGYDYFLILLERIGI